MTLIAAYIYRDTVQVIADSAETEEGSYIVRSNNNIESFNSFGEIIQSDKNKIVNESAQKICILNNSIVFAYSGVASEGNSVLEDLRINILINNETFVSKIISDFFLDAKPLQTEYIIGFYENNQPKIFYYQRQGNLLTKKDSFVILGSGSQNILLAEPLKFMLTQIAPKQNFPETFLVFLISLAQSYTLNALTFRDGVGGYFNGLYVDKNGINWVRDTCYIMYSSKNFEMGEKFIVSKYNRDDATFVTSPKIEKSVFFPKLNWISVAPEQWKEKWLTELLELNGDCNSYFYSFICYDQRIVNILSRSNDRLNNYLRFRRLNDTQMDFEMSDLLIKNLLTIPVNPVNGLEDPDGFGITLNYL